MQNAKGSRRFVRDRARSSASEILLALVLTLGAVAFLIVAYSSAG